jgi:hypothetical protein
MGLRLAIALAVFGWLCAIVTWGWLWWRGRQARGAVRAVPASVTAAHLTGPCMELQRADGSVQALMALKGAPPTEYARAHGRGSVTVYKPIGQDGSRWIYRAEA